MRKELLLGCGSQRGKVLYLEGKKEFDNLTTLDNNPNHKPDVLHDLTVHPLPFYDNEFDEIHAYEVLEHLAQQGDYNFFFNEFTEYWRILKPGGFLMVTTPLPTSPWAWGDPSHKRIISKESLVFLDQNEYEKQVGKTSMSDFRYIYRADFKARYIKETENKTLFILEAIK
jgi:SAM-dependent methyltransferase